MTNSKAQVALFAKGFKLAKRECCNYSGIGPFRKQHYCSLEPRQSEHQCKLLHGVYCLWFEQAVAPLNAGLLREWHREFVLKASIPKSATWTKSGRCECGALFRANSNRQMKCDECSARHRRNMQRGYRNRYRGKQSAKRALRAKIFQ